MTEAEIDDIIGTESDDEAAWDQPIVVHKVQSISEMVVCLPDSADPIEATMIDRITINPNVHFGKPCITGTRITVQNVLELLEEGLSFDEIIRDYYPDLEIEDIHASLRYAIALVAAEDIHLVPLPA